jgi:hypothetical protein
MYSRAQSAKYSKIGTSFGEHAKAATSSRCAGSCVVYQKHWVSEHVSHLSLHLQVG